MSYIYFAQSGESGPIKIGFADNVEKRIRSLQTGCPYKLNVLCAIPGHSKKDKSLRERFAGHSTSGGLDWFEPAKEITDYIQKLIDNGIALTRLPDCNPKAIQAEDAIEVNLGRFGFDEAMSKRLVSRKGLANMSGISLERIEAYCSDSAANCFSPKEWRQVSAALNTMFVLHKTQHKNKVQFSIENLFQLAKRMRQERDVDYSRTFNYIFDEESQTVQKADIIWRYEYVNEGRYLNISPQIIKRELTVNDIEDLANKFKVKFYFYH